MTKRIVAVNAGPRRGWNTDILIKEAVRGAEEAGATSSILESVRLSSPKAAAITDVNAIMRTMK